MKFYESTESMWKEISAAESHLERMLKGTDEMVERYHTEHYGLSGTKTGMVTANHAYEWLSIVTAQICAANPRAFTRARRPDVGQAQAIAFRHALNRWAVDTDLKGLLDKMFVDWAFRRAVGVLGRELNDAGPRDVPRIQQRWKRVSRKNYLYDVLATEHEDERWRGHRWIEDQDDLIEFAERTPGWDHKLIASLAANANVEDLRPRGVKNPGGLDRNDLVLYQVWLPEDRVDGYTEEMGYYGTIRTYAWASPDEGKASMYRTMRRIREGDGQLVEIAEPQPYFGRRQGPYEMNGQDYVPDQVEPLTQFVALEGFLLSMNVRGKVMQQAMEDYAKMIFVSAKDSSLAQKVRSGEHRGVIPVKGLTKDDIVAVEKGGLTDQMVKQWMLEKDRMDRLSGITDAMRGNVAGDSTATEQVLAQGGATARLAKFRNAWYRHVAAMLRGTAEMMFLDDEFAMALPAEAAHELNMRQPVLRGGRRPGESFDDLEIDVEPMSMEFMSEQRSLAYATQMADTYMAIAPMIAQYPYMDWRAILDNIGTAMNNPQMAEHVDFQLADLFAGVMLGGELQGASTSGGAQPKPTPTMSKNIPAARGQATPTPPSGEGAKPASGGARSSGNKAFGQAKQMVGAR